MAQWGLAKCGGTTLAPGAAQRTHAVPPLLCRHLPPFMGDWGRSPQKAGAFLTLWNEVPEEIWPFSLNILAMPVMGDGDGLATMPCRLPSFRQLWLAMAFGQSPARAVFCPISPAFGDFASFQKHWKWIQGCQRGGRIREHHPSVRLWPCDHPHMSTIVPCRPQGGSSMAKHGGHAKAGLKPKHMRLAGGKESMEVEPEVGGRLTTGPPSPPPPP